MEVLKAGGSAVDAAIAVNACLALMEPTSCGPGGDLFAIVWDPKAGRLAGLNASGRAPLALTIDKVPPEPDGTIPLYSPYAWTVPGLRGRLVRAAREVREAAHAPGARARDPLRRGGLPALAGHRLRLGARGGALQGHAGLRGGVHARRARRPREGEIFRNPALAKTLRLLAEKGRDAYYRGPIAEALVRYSQAHGGFFALEDFARHRSTWDEPISTDYRGWTVWELPPNGQGLAALQLLNLLENFDLKAMGRESADFWHVMTEAKKLAFADRARYYADPAFAKVPVEALLSKEYAKRRAALIDLAARRAHRQRGRPGGA